MIRFLCFLSAATMFMSAVSPLQAQRYGRSGFWVSAQGGLAYANIECGTICNDDASLAPVGVLQFGGTPTNETMLSLELSYWRFGNDTTAQDYGMGMVVLRFYPLASKPFYAKFGAGVGRYGEERVTAEGSRWVLSAHGFALQGGAGYEFPLFSQFTVGPAISYVAALGHRSKRNRLPTNDMTGRWVRLVVQITRR